MGCHRYVPIRIMRFTPCLFMSLDLVINVEISDVRVPEELQESLAAEAQAAREAAAKVALSRGELDASKILAEAARNLERGGRGAMAIRYLETMNSLNQGNFIIYPE